VTAFLATASVGAIWVGLNPRYRLAELHYVVNDADPDILLTRSQIEDRNYTEDLGTLRSTCGTLREIVIFDGDPIIPGAVSMRAFLELGRSVDHTRLEAARAHCGGRDPCLIVYTSGSTGAPKGALLHHEGIVSFSLAQNELWPVHPYRIVNYFPINHVGCVIDCTTPCLVAGGSVCFLEKFEPLRCMQLMTRERATIWGSVPTVFNMQLALPDFSHFDLSALQLIAWGGAAMPRNLIERLARICPRLATNYGMTETTSAITVIEPTTDIAVLSNSVGFPFPGVELRVVDERGRVCSSAGTGEIQTKSQNNFLGYWRRPDATEAAFTSDGWFRTGDLGELRTDGRLRLVGRIKEMYKSGGYNVYPREIELVLEGHPAVAVAAVVPAPDPLWQEIGVAYVVPRSPVTPEELESYCRNHLANYKVPKRILIEADLPLLPIGKVDKRALMARTPDPDEHGPHDRH
jgi:acyl-CoA synthetase (AMP-forming)/AMP-acid ligase II